MDDVSSQQATWAVVALKSPGRAKTRLRSVLDPLPRRRLALELATRVIGALQATRGIDRVAVVTASAEVADFARRLGCAVIGQAFEDGTAAAFATALRQLEPRRLQRLLMIAGDLPRVSPQALETLLASAGPGPGVVLVPDRHGLGTNALLCTPPQALAPCFGPDSLRRHLAAADATDVSIRVLPLDELTLDLDLPADLDELRRHDPALADRLLQAPPGGPRWGLA